MGDMNTTPFEAAGWRLPGKLVGNPFRHSWSGISLLGFNPWLYVRIDHIRLAQNRPILRPVSQQVGPDVGSDHLPVFARFALP